MSSPTNSGFLARIIETVSAWHERSRERHALAQLNAWQRRDIGLSPETIDSEINKPFWRA